MRDPEIRKFLQQALDLARKGMEEGAGGPFGCVIVRDGAVVGSGFNQVMAGNDPTAHAEVVAIRQACARLQTFQLEGCAVFCSCEPCPMCLGAIYWARPERVYFANSRADAAEAGFDDAFIYREIQVPLGQRTIPFEHVPVPGAREALREWKEKGDKKVY